MANMDNPEVLDDGGDLFPEVIIPSNGYTGGPFWDASSHTRFGPFPSVETEGMNIDVRYCN